jgi:hypothetical protein
MKSRLIPFILLLLSGSLVCAQNAKKLSVEDYERAASMLSKNLNGYIKNSIRPRWLNENKVWYELKTGDQVTYKLFDPAKSKMITNDSQSELFKKGKVSSIENQSSRVSPDGKYTAFIREWNLWMKENETGNEIQLTTDGVKDFGYATDNAGWRQSDRAIVSWSPDSKKIATYQQDQRHVHDMYLVKTKVGAPELMAWKYPLPGDEEIIKIHRVIIDVSGSQKSPGLNLPRMPGAVPFAMIFPVKEDLMMWPGVRTAKSWSLFPQVVIIKRRVSDLPTLRLAKSWKYLMRLSKHSTNLDRVVSTGDTSQRPMKSSGILKEATGDICTCMMLLPGP